mgnify:CR=1 FL=1
MYTWDRKKIGKNLKIMRVKKDLSQAALAERSDALRSLCAVILWQRTLYYQSLAASKETFRTFLRGWINRLARLWERCE